MGTFGQRLRELRNGRGISQNELSRHIGVSKSSVNMYERDEREPGFETLEAIADFFNVNMDYLLGRGPRITTKVNSKNIAITAQVDESQFSASAKPTLIKFIAGINSSDAPDFLEYMAKVRTEMDRTFSQDDFEHLTAILKSINDAYTQVLASIDQTRNFIPSENQQDIAQSTLSNKDIFDDENPTEGA